MSVFWKVDAPTISIVIACCAFLISFISITLSLLSYRKDRWKLSLGAWIEAPAPSIPSFPKAIRGRLFVETKNIGRRTLTIEGIALQVFKDELEEIRKSELARIEKVERIGFVAYFMSAQSFPVTVD